MSCFSEQDLYAAVIKELGEALIAKDYRISELQKELKSLKERIAKYDTLEKVD